MRLLVVEDDSMIGSALQALLAKDGHAVDWAEDGASASTALRTNTYDLVVLDLGLPRVDGLVVLRDMRARGDRTPVIVATARDAVQARISGLDAGADDYVTKPFGSEELLARVRAFLRRSYVAAKTSETKVEIGELRIDLTERRVFIADTDLHLTKTEYAILSMLARHIDSIVTHDEMIAEVWGIEYRGSNHYLHTYLGRLRKKMGEYGALIETVPGMGYDLHSKKIY